MKNENPYGVDVGTANFDARAVTKRSREEFISSNINRKYKDLPEDKQTQKLGEIWDLCQAKVQEVDGTPAPAKSKGKKEETAPKP